MGYSTRLHQCMHRRYKTVLTMPVHNPILQWIYNLRPNLPLSCMWDCPHMVWVQSALHNADPTIQQKKNQSWPTVVSETILTGIQCKTFYTYWYMGFTFQWYGVMHNWCRPHR